MNEQKKKFPFWALASGLLLVLAALARFVLRGYAYLAYTLAFFAALILLHRFLSRKLWRVVLVLVCLGFAYFIAVEIPIIRNARTDPDPEREYLIVLGAAVYGEQPSPSLQRRLQGALDYLETYPDSVAIVTGGQGSGEAMTEAACMYDWLTEHGVAPERQLREERATSTKENLAYSLEIIRARGDDPQGKVAVLSSPYHLYRAKLMARAQGVEAAGVAGAFDHPLLTLTYFIREAFGVTHLWVFGW